MARSALIALVCSFLITVSALPLNLKSSVIYAKELAGPASEFAQNALPLPDEVSQFQTSAFLAAWITSESSSLMVNQAQSTLWSGPLVCESAEGFAFSFLSPQAPSIDLTLVDPNGNNVDLSGAIEGVYAIGGTNVPETSWIFNTSVIGSYILTATSTSVGITRDALVNDTIPFAYVITKNFSPLTMVAHLNSYNMQVGQQIGLVAMILEDNDATAPIRDLTPAARRARAAQGFIISATMDIVLPDGTEEEVDMHDDGLHADFEANDGIYGAIVTATEVGTYDVQAILKGKKSDGVAFVRTTQHLISSVSDGIDLVGTATGIMTDSTHMTISLPVDAAAAANAGENTYRAYAEVYGTTVNGTVLPACWIGGITQVVTDGAASTLNVVLNTNWLTLAGVQAPLTLQNVLIQDTQSFVPLSEMASIAVNLNSVHSALLKSSLIDSKDISVPTKEMKEGVMPAHMRAIKDAQPAVTGAILLLHGYCSGTNPFSPAPQDWTKGYYFLRSSVSDTHDQFAQYVLQWASGLNLTSYAIVGHSQGGIIGAHIKNFYFSGLDVNSGSGRLLQSIGTPYEGCTAAGSSASLGSMFGVGCGKNFDLSLDGSKLWEPSITTDTRSEIYYYTTTYKQGTWFGDSCSAAMNMILEWPNDGTAEIVYTDIRDANNMGNVQKQCHTTGMNYMAQYQDHTRNAQMNTAAAR